ncbi:LPXTG-motif cell wall-anchored protein [Streptococcus rupicaprae]|uniref:LPXTG-motif cell wall-anchored protein n=1 Tax=Streptococcus rupicaprae TaxID=759619 RepID=A0ABV2FG88_9STRE
MNKPQTVLAAAALATTTLGIANPVKAKELDKPVSPKTQEATQSVTPKMLADAKADLEASKAETAGQTELVEARKEEQAEAKSEVNQLTTEASEAERLAEVATPEAVEQATEAVEKADTELKETTEAVERTETVMTQTEEAVKAQEAIVQEAESQVDVAQATVSESQGQVDQAKKLVDGQAEQAVKEQLEQTQTAVKTANEDVQEARTALEEAKTADQNHAKELEQAKERVESQQEAVEQATENWTTATSDLKEAQLVEDGLAVDVAAVQKQIADLKASLNASETQATKQLDTALNDLSKAQSMVKAAEQALATAQASATNQAQALQQAQEELKRNRTQLAQATQNLARLTHAYQAASPSDPGSLQTYVQTDPNWITYRIGNGTFGATGCAPTVLAMAITELTGKTVMPLEVGHYLYNNSNHFNKNFQGTSGQGLLQAARHYGLEATTLGNYASVVQALEAGNLVTAAVQQNKFSPWGVGYTHQILLHGLSNGYTYVYDPYTRTNNGWYPLANLWAEQSTDAIDTAGLGAPFVQFTTANLRQLKSGLAQARSTVNQLTGAVASKEGEVARLSQTGAQLSSAKTRLERAKALETQTQRAVNEANKALTKAQGDKTRLTEELEAAQERYQTLSTRLSDAKKDTVAKTTLRANAKSTLDDIKDSLRQAQALYMALLDKEASLPVAENRLTQALATQAEAQQALGLAQEAERQLALSLADREAVLAKAKEALKADQKALEEAQENRNQERAKLEELQKILAKSNQQLQALRQAQTEKAEGLKQAQAYLESLKQAPQVLAKKQSLLDAAQKRLEEQNILLEQAEKDLQALTATQEQLQVAYDNLLARYRAENLVTPIVYQTPRTLAYAPSKYQQLQISAPLTSQVPVIDERGQIVAVTPLVKNAAPQTKGQVKSTESSKTKTLPQTGDSASLNLLALGLLPLLTLFGYHRREN